MGGNRGDSGHETSIHRRPRTGRPQLEATDKEAEKRVELSADGGAVAKAPATPPNTKPQDDRLESVNNMDADSTLEDDLELSETTSEERRPYDLVIFAASGCVGRFLVEEVALVVEKYYKSNTHPMSSKPAQQFAQRVSRRRSVPSSSMMDNDIRWAIAGRSAVRLSETLGRAELSTGIKELSTSIPIILADLNHQRSLLDMCQKTKVVINCAGPYSELGAEILIHACIESQTNYIDLAHEVTFMENMRQKYSDKAKRAKVLILNGCGFQSMSAEMGLNFTKQVADGTIDQVKMILSLSDTSAKVKLAGKSARATGIVSEGMWNSLIAEKAQEVSIEDRLRQTVPKLSEAEAFHQLRQQQQQEAQTDTPEVGRRLLASQSNDQSEIETTKGTGAGDNDTISAADRRLFSTKMFARKDTQSLVKDIVQFRNRTVSMAWPLRLIQGFQGRSGRGYCWPIDNMSSDEAQLIRSEMINYELRRPDLDSVEGWRPIRCSTFLSVKNFTQLSCLFAWLFVFQIVVKFSLFRFVMRKFPQFATLGHVVSSRSAAGGRQHSGAELAPSRQPIERDSLTHIKFCQTFIAYGVPSDESSDPLEQSDGHAARNQVQLLVARVVGPEPNHVATATYAVQAAITLLTERDHLPCDGGVLTPGAAFSETSIIFQLRRRNIKFEVLKKA